MSKFNKKKTKIDVQKIHQLDLGNMYSELRSFFSSRSNLSAALLLLVVSIIPFIVRLHVLNRDVNSLDFIAFPFAKGNFDLFHYYKGVVLIIISFLLLITTGAQKQKSFSWIYYVLFPFAFLVLLSSILSEYKGYTIMGGAESFQGVFVWISYVVICFGATKLTGIKHFKWVINGLLIGGGVMSILGLFQFFGYDIRGLFENLIYHSGYKMKVTGRLNHYITSLAYNPNYYGVFLVMALLANLTLFLNTKKRYAMILGLNYILIYANLVGSQSRVANFTFIICSLLLPVFLRKKNKELTKKYLFILAASAVVYFSMTSNFMLPDKGYSKLKNIYLQDANSSLKEIDVSGNVMEIRPHTLPPLFIKIRDDGNVNFGKERSFKNLLGLAKGDTIKFKDNNYSHYKFYFKKTNQNKKYLVLRYDDIIDYNILISKGTFKTFDHRGKAVDIINPPKWGFFNRRNTSISRRGMLWALSAPILKNTFFLGYGADSFPLGYPNNDYVSRIKTWGNKGASYATASHSLYFQIGIEFGVVALLLFLSMILIYFWKTSKLLWKLDFEHWAHFLALGCLLSVCSYAITGITNSSMLSSSPNFWVLLGLGIATNQYILKLEKGRAKN